MGRSPKIWKLARAAIRRQRRQRGKTHTLKAFIIAILHVEILSTLSLRITWRYNEVCFELCFCRNHLTQASWHISSLWWNETW